MKNKNTIVFLLLVFVAICGYNLYWTFVQFSMERKMENLRQAITNPADTTAKKQYDALLSDADYQERYKTAVDRSFTLGLDLQGGMFVTLEIGVEALIKQMAGNPTDTTFQSILDCTNLKQQSEARSYVSLFVECFKEINPSGSLGATFANPELEISVGTPDNEVEAILENEATSAIDRTFNIIRTRIDQFGVVSPNLQKQEGTGRILLELPGVKEPERVRKLLRSTAKLEFYATHPWNDAYPVLLEINEKMKQIEGIEPDSVASVDSAATDSATVASAQTDSAGTVAATTDSANADTTFSTENLAEGDSAGDLPFDQLSKEEQEKRRAEFRKTNPFFAVLSPANFDAMAQAQSTSPRVGAARAQDTAAVNKILKMEEIRILIPDDMRFVWSFKPMEDVEEELYEMIAIRVNDDGTADLSGDQVSLARQDFDPSSGKPVVSMRMTAEGTKEWGRITEANVGKHVAILLDNYIYSYPIVNEAITGGSSQIAGDFTIDEAKDLANVLKAGQLPVPAQIEGEETVGPTLGAENIRGGLYSFLIAFAIILIFMAAYYNKSGLVANIALLANLIFILGCSAAFTIVLTLPGIGAIVLTIGMAVDANILIFERIREELARDKTLKASIKAGFSNAFSSIMDGNITTFLTGVVLYAFGVGPIRGFAVSLMIGIITTLISALVISRLILDYYSNKGKDSMNFGFNWSLNLFNNLKLQMVERRRMFYMISGTLIAISLISFVAVGFKTGVDFKGGRQFVVEFMQNGAPVNLSGEDIEQIRGDLNTALKNTDPVIKTLSSNNQLMITTSYLIENRQATDSVSTIVLDGLKQNFGQYQTKILSTSDVGPTVANDIRQAAFLSVIFSLMIIFFYILLRFRKWQYSLGAVAALFHDVIITLGAFSVLSLFDLSFSVEINQALIAALLTIIGYSINDTVIVFDRIRENIGEMKSTSLSDIYNISIDQTLSRTIMTSLTTLMTAFVLFFFGGDVIKGFTLAIIIGISVGTYSSVFIASAIALDFLKKEEKPVKAENPAKAEKPAKTEV
ncbi:MAG: protein translocase subunit SecDF [Bacteroidia bacterium]|nr:protein translocase subunit SecDF [Bacteroidia bacterium]